MHTAFGFDLGANECVCVAVFFRIFFLLLRCCCRAVGALWVVGQWAVGGWAGWGWVTAD